MIEDFLLKQFEVFSKVLAQLLGLRNAGKLTEALELIQQNIDTQLLDKLKNNDEGIFEAVNLSERIQHLINLKFQEIEILKILNANEDIINEKSKQTAHIVSQYIDANKQSYFMELEFIKKSLSENEEK